MRIVEELLLDASDFDAQHEFALDLAVGDQVLSLQTEIGEAPGSIFSVTLFERSPSIAPAPVYRDTATHEVVTQRAFSSTYRPVEAGPSKPGERRLFTVDVTSGLCNAIAIPKPERTSSTCRLRVRQAFGLEAAGWLIGVRVRIARAAKEI